MSEIVAWVIEFAPMAEPRDSGERDEWRVEVANSRRTKRATRWASGCESLDLDDEARKRLGGAVIVTRDGSSLFLYAWHEESAREAERVVRELMEEDGLAGQVQLVRWHPVAEQWRPADEPLPESEAEVAAEQAARERSGRVRGRGRRLSLGGRDRPAQGDATRCGRPSAWRRRATRSGGASSTCWSAPPARRPRSSWARASRARFPRAATSVSARTPRTGPAIGFTWLGNLKPGVMRDLGI